VSSGEYHANYSTVMSLLHRQSLISCSLKKTGETEPFNGMATALVSDADQYPPKAQDGSGDTAITSQYATRFPQR
jgi:rod shape-determining protein MreC